MNILHYALGFPPYRTGGLTKYCVDLMLTQQEQGHQVSLLWPGEILPWRKQKIRKHKDYSEICSYKIINPLPVALDEGILEPSIFMTAGDFTVYENFIRSIKPDVLHVHTLMGLHRELLEAAKKYGTKLIFTTHDYYGICPKVTLFRSGQTCDCDHDCADCVGCNQTGLSMRKIAIMQSAFYRTMKNSFVVKALRKRHRTSFFDEQIVEKDYLQVSREQVEGYQKLRKYYLDMLSEMDVIHFNSTVTKDVYVRYFAPKEYRVIPVTHRGIADHRKVKEFSHEKLRITYLGPAKYFKGYGLLKEVLDELWNEEKFNFELRMYNVVSNPSPYMIMQDGYQYNELEDIFDQTDVMIAPSVWYETFGFTVLEALSYGVPVIVSENVGAKDIAAESQLICAADKKGLKEAIIKMFDVDRLKLSNKRIVEEMKLPLIQGMTEILY